MFHELKELFKLTLRSIYHHWSIQLPMRGIKILYKSYVYTFFHKSRYKYLQEFHDIHKGDRCFIVATGPSLTLEDVDKLKGEYTFGMNSVYKLFDKTDWRPTYYAIVDTGVYGRIKDEINEIKFNCTFCPDESIFTIIGQSEQNKIPFKRNWCITHRERELIGKKHRPVVIGTDMTKLFYEGSSVTHFIMQIAFYMGFSEIYLLGADCNFFGQVKHSKIVAYKDSDKIPHSGQDLYDGLIADYEAAKVYAENNGIKIFNATRGGMLEVFERVDLDKVLKNSRIP